MGDCIMPREGVFARVVQGGLISTGDEMKVRQQFRTWIIISSDKGSKGEREDKSGPVISELIASAGYVSVGYTMLSDDQGELEKELKRICDNNLAELILTAGGTGFAPRDRTPEATLAAAERLVPGIAEAMRAGSLGKTKRAMLSRGISAIRGSTLIINLPGSPKAAEENLSIVLPELRHGLEILTEKAGECGSS
jgi:molybdenum cofactor synthesis domain-containing protein